MDSTPHRHHSLCCHTLKISFISHIQVRLIWFKIASLLQPHQLLQSFGPLIALNFCLTRRNKNQPPKTISDEELQLFFPKYFVGGEEQKNGSKNFNIVVRCNQQKGYIYDYGLLTDYFSIWFSIFSNGQQDSNS